MNVVGKNENHGNKKSHKALHSCRVAPLSKRTAASQERRIQREKEMNVGTLKLKRSDS